MSRPAPGGFEEWPATRIFYENLAAKDMVVINIGGARSSKSYSIIQLFVSRFFTERGKRFLTTRKTFPALRATAYQVAQDMMAERRLLGRCEHNKSEHVFRNHALGNYWLFSSFDDPEKMKSTEFNHIHMEEGNEYAYDDFKILKLRLSGKVGPGERNQLYLTLNPNDDQGWIHQELMQKEPHALIKSTYRDNPFLPAEYVLYLESLKDQDPEYWQIYGLGLWAPAGEMIYGPLEIVAELPVPHETIYGLDFGYNNPTVLEEIGVKEWTIGIRELVHRRYLTNADLIKQMNEVIPPDWRRRPIYADPSEPDRIEEIHRAGFNIKPADTPVSAGIVFVKRFRRLSLAQNDLTNREFRNYKWKKDRLGRILDEPVKFEDHSPDAVRYPVWTHLKNRGAKRAFVGQTKEDVY